MTPDELFTRIHNLQRDLIATKTAQEALMIALPAEQQELWLQALYSLRSTRVALLEKLAEKGADAMGLQEQIDAIGSRFVALDQARRSFVKDDAEGQAD
ncbi:MAG: hypothetical protein A3I66_00720 [Burkholderiales bacterium RIFCSPLOWO2_02_FULL_57_36]|nr:MAG: hypothetical protein A3I66_00720 [Burkholderiales bacterium RIFCSPLOWO2_02_FULL_57_36]